MQAVKGDYNGYYSELGGTAGQRWTGPPGWELGDRLTTCYRKKILLGNLNCGLETVRLNGISGKGLMRRE